MNEPIENLYFNWLYSKVADVSVRLPTLRFWQLFDKLHRIEFVFIVSGDDNRAEDGLDLRTEFINEGNFYDDELLPGTPCSVLEMLIAFSRKASFETDESPQDWFWVMLNNIGLSACNDASRPNASGIQERVDVFRWRTYDANGHGSLFPLNNPQNDQREVEIWYQFFDYLVELNYD